LESAIKSLGYKWRKRQSKRRILLERADIVDRRSRYVVKIKACRDKGRPIIRKCWQNEEVMGVQTNVNSANRLYHAPCGGK
jgi:hypothetical protein